MKLSTAQLFDYCKNQQINLTSQQSLIIGIIANNQEPLTAHDILLNLRQINPKANRMTIHRALEFLIKAELIHKVTFNHTYKLCNHLYCNHEHHCQILICQICGKQIEVHNPQVTLVLQEASKTHGFIITNPVEITGKCQQCS